MATPLLLDDLRRAWGAQDPELAELIVRVAQQPDEPPETPPRQGAPTFESFIKEIRGHAFHKKPKEEQGQLRQEMIKALESPTAEVPLTDRLRSHEIMLALWNDGGPVARSILLKVIAHIPLVYGPWRALKHIFKEAEARNDTEIWGALIARFDSARAELVHGPISGATLTYLCRRAWRYMRHIGLTLPACYADIASDVLIHYTDETRWFHTWVANHIFFHESKKYGRSSFSVTPRDWKDMLKSRAFADLWQRSPRPLFSLIELARSEQVREFAVTALKTDFRAVLREVEPTWVARLVQVQSKVVHGFVVWILTNVPRFEQSAFRKLGLHDAVLQLFDSPAHEARAYAAEYARTHARDLPIGELVRLANNDHDAVKKLVVDLLQDRDPRKDVGLDAWGQLLETKYGPELAASVLKKHFGAKELTPAWFKDRLFAPSLKAFNFAKDYLPQVHPIQTLGAGYFQDLIEACDDPKYPAARNIVPYELGNILIPGSEQFTRTADQNVIPYAMEELARFDLNMLDADFQRRLVLHPLAQNLTLQWINEGRLKPQTLGADFFKTLAYQPAWSTDPWFVAFRQSERRWARELVYVIPVGDRALGWLADVRIFSPREIGMDWLLQLVASSDPRYHDFAVERLIKSFAPADFAPVGATGPAADAARLAGPIDLAKASFVFTGKLATMTRAESEQKVKDANGVNFSSVSAKLHYLVIGDEGSPLYGAGSKGTKQLKAEDLNAKGANIKIISETAFLQMLAGKKETHSADATLAGCQRLWEMATAAGPTDAPLAQFARKFIRRHHPDICLAETDRPVDIGTEIPASFLTCELVAPLLAESRKPLRDFALDLARWEFARWSPPTLELVRLCELPYAEVRKFVADALLADESPATKRYRINPDSLTPAGVYRFCESLNEVTRVLGIQLIERSPRLRQPEELFRLTESPDRKVRAFVIRSLWSVYRERGVTADWKPNVPPQPTVGAGARKEAAALAEKRGDGVPHHPDKRPAGDDSLRGFLRRILFELPPARSEPVTEEDRVILAKLKPMPARKAKLSLVEIMRDLAVEDAAFAQGVLPVLQEFMTSFGTSERDACLVAVTRIRHFLPESSG